MAKIELKFLDAFDDIYIKTYGISNYIEIESRCGLTNESVSIILDKSTAIKFAKTLRTEINKIQ